MKSVNRAFAAIVTALVAASIFCLGGLVGSITAEPEPPAHAVCLQSHREVVMIPTICGEHDVCQKPIVTEVCERIESPPPEPVCPSSGADDDE